MEEHIQQLEEIFKRLREASLKVHPGKCVFGADIIDFLGHRISANSLQPEEEKLAAPASTHRSPQPACNPGTLLLLPEVRTALHFHCPPPQPIAKEGCSVAVGRQTKGGIPGTQVAALSVSGVAAAKRIQAVYPHNGHEPQGDGSGVEPTR